MDLVTADKAACTSANHSGNTSVKEKSGRKNKGIQSREDFNRALRQVEDAINNLNRETLKAYLINRIKFYRLDSEESGVILWDHSSHLCRLIYLKAIELFPGDKRTFYLLLPEHEKNMLRILYSRDTIPVNCK